MTRPTPITDLVTLLERSATSGRKAHIPAALARAMIEHPAYGMLVETRTQELIAGFQESPSPSARRKAAAVPEGQTESGKEALERARNYLNMKN